MITKQRQITCAFLGSHDKGLLNKFNGIDTSHHQSLNNNSSSKVRGDTTSLEYHLRETEQLIEISLLKKKLRATERAMESIIADINAKKSATDTSATASIANGTHTNGDETTGDEGKSNAMVISAAQV